MKDMRVCREWVREQREVEGRIRRSLELASAGNRRGMSIILKNTSDLYNIFGIYHKWAIKVLLGSMIAH